MNKLPNEILFLIADEIMNSQGILGTIKMKKVNRKWRDIIKTKYKKDEIKVICDWYYDSFLGCDPEHKVQWIRQDQQKGKIVEKEFILKNINSMSNEGYENYIYRMKKFIKDYYYDFEVTKEGYLVEGFIFYAKF